MVGLTAVLDRCNYDRLKMQVKCTRPSVFRSQTECVDGQLLKVWRLCTLTRTVITHT